MFIKNWKLYIMFIHVYIFYKNEQILFIEVNDEKNAK